jgi:hypothetical protein
VTFGVPLPAGAVHADTQWRLSSAGAAESIQTRVLDRWRDGSARWILVDSRVTTGADEQSELFLESEPSAEPPAAPAIEIEQEGDRVTIDTGSARFEMRTGETFPFARVETSLGSAVQTDACGLTITDATGAPHRAVMDRVGIEERGSFRTVVKLMGGVRLNDSDVLEITARMHFFAGQSIVRLLVTLTNPNAARHKGGFWDLGDPGSVLIGDASIVLPFVASPAVSVQATIERDQVSSAYVTPFEIYQDSSGGEHWQSTNHVNRDHKVPNTFRGYRATAAGATSSGLRATPIVSVTHSGGRLTAAVPQFWENFPKAIEATDSSLIVRLFPAQYGDKHEIQGGEQKTHECFIGFGDDAVSDVPFDWCRNRIVVRVDPEWCLSSGAIPFLAPLEDDHATLVNAAVDGPDCFEAKREIIDEYGWRHFGEVYGDHESVRQKNPPIVSHYNNQYDPIAGFALQFLRTADARWWAMMDDLAHHVIDIDIYHTVRDKWAYNHGLFWHTYHYGDADTATHRTYPLAAKGHIHGGGPSADHNYTTGLMLHYFLTGEEASRQTVIDLAEYVLNLDDGGKTIFRWLDRGDTGRATLSADHYGPGRSPANSVNALVDGHRLSGAPRMLAKAEQLICRVVHPDEDIARHGFGNIELRWFYTMFLQSLGKYLHYKIDRGEIDRMFAYGRATLLHYARWMLEHEHPYLDKPEKLEFPTETWAAQDIRKSDVFLYAALHATGAERITFVEKARFYQRYSIDTLHQKPTRTLARPVIVLLTSGFMDGWFARHRDASEPMPTERYTFREPQIFLPQRKRAERRLMWLAGGAILFLLGAGALLLR